MDNPFQSNNIRILREAFPNVEERVIDDILYTTRGDINEAFEVLLSMSNGESTRPTAAPLQQHRPPPPPQRPIHHSTSMPFSTYHPPQQQQKIIPPRQMTVREELAQWRQDLREESRLKASRALSARVSSSSLSLSNLLHSRNKSSPQVQQQCENHNYTPLRERHSTQRLSVPASSSFHSISDPSYHLPTSYSSTNQPGLPPRRTPSSQTNPFLPPPPPPPPPPTEIQSSRSSSRVVPLPPLPPRREEEPHSFNPFEEESDVPPPAYSEIQRDTIIQVQGHTG